MTFNNGLNKGAKRASSLRLSQTRNSFSLSLVAAAVMSGLAASAWGADYPRHANWDNAVAQHAIVQDSDFAGSSRLEETKEGSQDLPSSSATQEVDTTVLVRVDAGDPVNKTITASDLNLTYTIKRPEGAGNDAYSLAGGTLLVADGTALSLSGTNIIVLDVQNGRTWTDGGDFNAAVHASTLAITGGTTTVTTNAHDAGSPSVTGVGISESLTLSEEATLNINVTTGAVADPSALKNTSQENPGVNDYEMQAEGLNINEGATLDTAAGSTLRISVVSEADSPDAAFANGLVVGGAATFNGTTEITAQANGGYAVGVDLGFEDSEPKEIAFNGKTTITATSEKLLAVGIAPDDTTSEAVMTFGELDVTSEVGSGEVAGVMAFDNNTMNFKGPTTITARIKDSQLDDTVPQYAPGDQFFKGNATGLDLQMRSEASFSGTTANITVESAANSMVADADWPNVAAGISMSGPATLTSTADNTLTINATSTGAGSVTTTAWDDSIAASVDRSNYAGFVSGLIAEGGTINLAGNVSISAKGAGAYASGMTLQALAGDSDWASQEGADYSTNVTFGGDLTVSATSETGGAEAIILGGYVPLPDGEDYPENVTVTMTTAAGHTTTITADSGAVESVGVNFVYPDAEGNNPVDTPEEFTTGRGVLNLNGTTVITAAHALKGDVGTVNNAGDLTLNGRVDQFKGSFTQTAGTTTLNDDGFFGGDVTISGGSLTAADADWSSGEGAGRLAVSAGELTLGSMTINDASAFDWTGGKITTSSLVIAEGQNVAIQGNTDTDLTINGSAMIQGSLTGVKNLTFDGSSASTGRGDFVSLGDVIATETITVRDATSYAGAHFDAPITYLERVTSIQDSFESQKYDRLSEYGGDGEVYYRDSELLDLREDGSTVAVNGIWTYHEDDETKGGVQLFFDSGEYDFGLAVHLQAGNTTVRGNTVMHTPTLDIDGGSMVLSGLDGQFGRLEVDTILFNGESGSLKLDGGELVTSTGQIFSTALDENGGNSQVESLREDGRFEFGSGTLTFNDKFFNDLYANEVRGLIGQGVLINFTGTLNTAVNGKVSIDDINGQDGLVYSGITATIDSETGSATIDKTIGVGSIEVGEGVDSVSVSAGSTLTLAGQNGSLITFADGDEGKTVQVNGTLALGLANSEAAASVGSKLEVVSGAALEVNGGNLAITEAAVDSGTVAVNGGAASFESLTMSGKSTLETAREAAATTVESLTLGSGTLTITGALQASNLQIAQDAQNVSINIGTTGEAGKAGDLTIASQSLQGASYFLDPVYVDGQTIEDASALKFAGDKIDGRIVVGENSYAVLGSTDASGIFDAADKGYLSWGDGEGENLAAVYVAKPVTIDAASGGLKVDGTVNANSGDKTVTAGSVVFAANSALVADVTGLDGTTAVITASNPESITVAEGSKAVPVGDIRQGVGYLLTNNTAQNLNWADNLVAGNALWKLEMGADGTIGATLQDAGLIYGDLMQGSALANAGMLAGGEAYDYVNALLTDASGNISALPSVAARFDAAMNPAGALTAFTTAYDRASDLRQVVREESVKGEGNRLWAQFVGGKTKLDGISSGGQDINTETDVYGIVVGGEAQTERFTFGAAFTAGTGKTENDAVDGEDDFDFYGLSLYGKTTVAGFDILGDISATWLKSDFTIGGAADVDTDTTTAVYSFGVQGEKTFELSWADLTPFIGVDVYHLRSDGFNNGHGAEVDDSDATAVEFPIGARITKDIETTGGFSMTPSFMLAVVPTVADTEIDSKVRFAGAESTYNYTFADDVKIRSRIGLDATKGGFTFGLRAGYEWGDEERSALNMQLRAKYAF